MIHYYPPTDEFIIINHAHNIYEIISHQEYNRLEMMQEKQQKPSLYALRSMFPTHFPPSPAPQTDRITPLDIAKAKDVPITTFIEKNYEGFAKCLFHDDKNASMKIYPHNYHCFSCAAHGDVIALVQKIYSLSFVEAVKKLAW